jgi:hypothetical protein
MSILKKTYILFLTFIFTISSVNALVLEWDITLDNATENSLQISWPVVDGALWYFVYYDTQSHAEDKNYTNTTDDMIETNSTTLENLKAGTNYYIALKVVDWDGNEWDFSNEYKFSTNWASNTSALSIENIETIDANTVLVEFNVDIDTNKDYEFKIEEKNNNLNEISIKSINIDNNKVVLSLYSDLESNKDYTLTVISLTWVNGETIEEGVDWIIDFNTWEIVELNSAEDNAATSDSDSAATENNASTSDSASADINDWNNDSSVQEPELNSAAPENANVSTSTWNTTDNLSWKNLSDAEIKKTAELAAKKSKKLPQTGPAEWLLFIAALIIAFGIIRFRKQA